ncbi:heterokaryon incompatibility protein-domain-containing protein [Xylariaceae sp. FL0594]|nr:heterokaryon incompatibility protein-domain-containing protein [Xylariaceae sp. FL0594]
MASNSFPLYAHKDCPLQHARKDLRILEILGNDHSPTIQCKLFQNQDEDEYDTLSWCWGSRTESSQEIHIIHSDEMFSFPVSSNLYAALIELRRIGVRRIWIDYICIDQNNHEEKNNQVPMMARIYGHSRRVYVWLGPAADNSDVARDFIETRVLNLPHLDQLIEDTEANEKWRALGELIKRPWFSRRWIIQEIALAQDAYMLCGQKKFRWVDFADAISLFNEVETGTKSLSEHMRSDKALKHMPAFFGHLPALNATRLVEQTNNLFWRVTKYEREAKLTLDHLVTMFTTFESNEPLDTIYALLALASDSRAIVNAESDPEVAKNVAAMGQVGMAAANMLGKRYEVDYGLPLSDVYVDFYLMGTWSCLGPSSGPGHYLPALGTAHS